MKTPARLISSVALLAAFSLPAAAGMFGPSTAFLKGEELEAKLQSQPLVLVINARALEVRSKSAAVGGFLLGFIASSAMASGGGMPLNTNAQQLNQSMQANMQIATEFNKNFQTVFTAMAAKQGAEANAQLGREGPVVIVAQQLMASLLQSPAIKASPLGKADKLKAADLQLLVAQPEWELDFSMASSDYALKYRIEVSVYQKEADTLYFKNTCQGIAPNKMPKDEWEKDDMAAVASAALDAGNQCARQVIAALGLQPVNEAPRPVMSAAGPAQAPDQGLTPATSPLMADEKTLAAAAPIANPSASPFSEASPLAAESSK